MSRWYRAYTETVTDPKLGEVALVAGCSRSVAIAAWHCILESAAQCNAGGVFDTTPRRVAVILGEPIAAIEAVFAEMKALAMIGDATVSAWAKRQFESDNSTERSRKHRNAKRNDDATLRGRDATAPYTDTDTDTEKKKKITLTARPSEVAGASAGGLPAGHGRADVSDAKTWAAIQSRIEQIPESRLIADAFIGPIVKLAAEFDLETEIIPTLTAELRRPGGSHVRSWSLMATRLRERITSDRAATARGESPQIRGSPPFRAENPLVTIGRAAMQEIEARRT